MAAAAAKCRESPPAWGRAWKGRRELLPPKIASALSCNAHVQALQYLMNSDMCRGMNCKYRRGRRECAAEQKRAHALPTTCALVAPATPSRRSPAAGCVVGSVPPSRPFRPTGVGPVRVTVRSNQSAYALEAASHGCTTVKVRPGLVMSTRRGWPAWGEGGEPGAGAASVFSF